LAAAGIPRRPPLAQSPAPSSPAHSATRHDTARHAASHGTAHRRPAAPYVKQCREDDPHLTQCFIAALHHVRPFIAKGIPEIELPPVEPFRLEELSLALSSGPGGYRVTLRDLDIFGASNFTVQRLALGGAGKPFEARILIPQLAIDAKYSSSGVLIILPASGNGTFHATLGDVNALLRGRAVVEERQGDDGAAGRFLRVQSLALDLAIKTVRMRVRKAFNNNRILTEATNLFLRENGHEVVKAMMPQLRGKLADVFQQIANGLLAHVPIDLILLPAADPAPAA
ncbi:Protein takeout, partial [Gryllus bimaculatus]